MRKILKTPFFVLVLLLLLPLSSCNQNLLGAGYAVKNLFATPFKAISNGISNFQYNSIAEKDDNKKSYNTNECWVKRKAPLDNLSDIEKITDAVRGNVCSCVPWGSCTTAECPCSRMCPDNFDIFKRPERKSLGELSFKENSLPFRNGGGGSSVTTTQGFCWGHASVTSKFNRLAFFKENETPKHSLKSKDEKEYGKALDYYKEIVDKIIDNEPVNIPGYKNLNDFASEPGIQEYIADQVAHSWADRAMTFNGIDVALKSNPRSKKENQKFFKDIVKKVDQNQQPQIVFTGKDSKFMTHAVLVSHYEKQSDGSTKLCIRDNNYSRTRGPKVKCRENMTINADGSVRYSAWGDLGGLNVAHNENPDSLTQFKNLKERCNKEKGCSK
ncbi:hypothetical protein A9Q84_02480 [Halobacteriovorax marinus]|uniref:Lipoprotein n=1 Tax=Halobacteriovorax marinus TaxID=97084 RepID=A0A1Y5FGN2_9BACT|nr:hypothetical protein A9Q84_02480 [Halobacteriovorax marinus]